MIVCLGERLQKVQTDYTPPKAKSRLEKPELTCSNSNSAGGGVDSDAVQPASTPQKAHQDEAVVLSWSDLQIQVRIS